jgi:hypothetical protein
MPIAFTSAKLKAKTAASVSFCPRDPLAQEPVLCYIFVPRPWMHAQSVPQYFDDAAG